MAVEETKVDKDGYILTGRFAGKHVSTLASYAASLEDASRGGQPPKPPKKDGDPPSPEEELERHAVPRVDAATTLTAKRFREDDLAAFRARVGNEEADKYIKDINTVLDGLSPAAWVTRDIHWTIYVQMKSKEPDFDKRLKGEAVKPAETQETAEQKAAREKSEAEAAEAKAIADARALLASKGHAVPETPRGPQAAPPTVPPTPQSRQTGGQERKPKLVANDKTRRAAREWGMSTDAYLLKLEDQGLTQEDLDGLTVPREETRRKSIYDRPSL